MSPSATSTNGWAGGSQRHFPTVMILWYLSFKSLYGDSTTSLGTLFQCLAIPSMSKCFVIPNLNLTWLGGGTQQHCWAWLLLGLLQSPELFVSETFSFFHISQTGLSSDLQVLWSVPTLQWFACAFSWQMSTSAPRRTAAATTAAATPSAATTASVQLARGWGKMENPVQVMLCAMSRCY